MLAFQLRNAIYNIRFTTSSAACSTKISRRNLSLTSIRWLSSPQLTPYDVNLVLRENEFSQLFIDGESPLLGYESNQVASNRPVEDSRTEASFIHKNAFICGVFDGHAGSACSQVISKRLLRYIAAGLVDRKTLREEIAKGCTSQSFLKCHNDSQDFVKEIQEIYEKSFDRYVRDIVDTNMTPEEAMDKACMQLDADMSREALEHSDLQTLMAVAMSGAVACVAHIEGRDLSVVSTGDCAAVLGYQNDTGQWMSKKLSYEHNSDNVSEVKRILSEHPPEEADTVIRNDRLLSQLAPLRAFGDFRYKWSNEIMQKHVVAKYGENYMAPNYYTPPYLTAMPEIIQHQLTADDKFLVIASDGLWDFLSPHEVISLVGEHLSSKKFLDPLKLPNGDVTLGQISDILAKRKAGRQKKPLDQNSATHLIRNALGGTDYGIEHSKISYYLSLPQDVVRLYRDDITVTVIYFNSDHIKQLS